MPPRPRSPNRPRAAGRGQLTVDFVIGVVVFVVAVAVVVGFVPQLFEPFDDAETTVVVDRVADDLAGDLLASETASAPGVLNESCTVAFFGGPDPGDCRFNTSASLSSRFGVADYYRINVTVEWKEPGNESTEVLCYDGGSVGSCGSELAAGPDVPQNRRSVATATRVVRMDDSDRTVLLRIRVWSS